MLRTQYLNALLQHNQTPLSYYRGVVIGKVMVAKRICTRDHAPDQ